MIPRSWIRSFCLAAALTLVAPDLLAEEGPPLQGDFRDFTPLAEPVPAPGDRFFDSQELPVSLAEFRGRVLLVNFWATWCPPCVYEMPSLDRLQGALGGEGLQVIAVSVDSEGIDIVRSFLRDLAVQNLEAYIDPLSKLARSFRVGALPTSYVVDAEGRVRGMLRSPAEWDSDEGLALLRHYLEEAAASGALDSGG